METNNNPNWLITKDIAKKLKEIGYKEQCLLSLCLKMKRQDLQQRDKDIITL